MTAKKTLSQRVADLEARLAQLETRSEPSPATPSPDALAQVDALANRRGPRFRRNGRRGAVTYAGAVRFGTREFRWTMEHALPDVLEADLSGAAKVLECLGSGVRLTLLRRLLDGPCDRQTLQAELSEGSTGQLYHHLRDLHAAGLIQAQKRGVYMLVPHAVVPFLTALVAAADIGTSGDERLGASEEQKR